MTALRHAPRQLSLCSPDACRGRGVPAWSDLADRALHSGRKDRRAPESSEGWSALQT